MRWNLRTYTDRWKTSLCTGCVWVQVRACTVCVGPPRLSSESMPSGRGQAEQRAGVSLLKKTLNTKRQPMSLTSPVISNLCVCVSVRVSACMRGGRFLRTASTARPALRATEPCWTWPSTAAAPRPKTRLVRARVCTCLCARGMSAD